MTTQDIPFGPGSKAEPIKLILLKDPTLGEVAVATDTHAKHLQIIGAYVRASGTAVVNFVASSMQLRENWEKTGNIDEALAQDMAKAQDLLRTIANTFVQMVDKGIVPVPGAALAAMRAEISEQVAEAMNEPFVIHPMPESVN
jgi:hypothetical protein